MIRKQAFMHYSDQPMKDYIKMVYDLAPKKTDTAGSSSGDEYNSRFSNVSWIENSIVSKKLFDYLWILINDANQNGKYNFDLQFIEPLQFTEYSVEQKYDWHVDQLIDRQDEHVRKLSFTCLLNSDFEGGELELECGSPSNPNRIHAVDLKAGDIVFFPSYTWHRVKPVTKGIRHSLVGWIQGPEWR